MKALTLLIHIIPIMLFSQDFSSIDGPTFFKSIPVKDGQIVYEKVFYLDSTSTKEKVFSAAKAALIKNTNYKYSKIDEDRVSGNISTVIRYDVTNNAGLKVNMACASLLSIDVKENRFRVRITSHEANTTLLGQVLYTTMQQAYTGELKSLEDGKWKAKRSYLLVWDTKLKLILEAFGSLISTGINDDF